MSIRAGVRKVDTLLLHRRHQPGKLSVTVDIRLDVRTGEFLAEHGGREFKSMSLPRLRDEIREHDDNVDGLKWEPVICIKADWASYECVEVLGVSYWRMFRARAGKRKPYAYRAWKGDTGGRFSELRKESLDVEAVGEPSTWQSCASGVTVLPYDGEVWKGLRTLSRMEVELKAKLEAIASGKKPDLVAFLLRASKGTVPLLGDGAGKETTC